LVAEVAEGERELVRNRASLGQQRRSVGEEMLHRDGTAQVSGAVRGEQAAGAVERGVMSQASEYISDLPVLRPRVGDAAGGELREPEAAGQCVEHGLGPGFPAHAMTLDLDEEAPRAENPDQRHQRGGGGLGAAGGPGAQHGAVGVPGEGDEPVGVGG
jgi:hypothetical protein